MGRQLAGRVGGDAGIFGLTQSFILAGANAVSISLWRAADESTSQFMATIMCGGMVQDKGISYAEAITEVKRRFISGSFGEKYKAPYYWAPFVYYETKLRVTIEKERQGSPRQTQRAQRRTVVKSKRLISCLFLNFRHFKL